MTESSHNTNHSNANNTQANASHYDVVIAGAGLVGASMACAIATLVNAKLNTENKNERELSIAVVDPNLAPTLFSGDTFDPRVVALSLKSEQFLKSLSVWEKVIQHRITPYEKMFVWDGEGTANIDFNCRDFKQNQLGYIVENSVVLDALLSQMVSLDAVDFLQGEKIDSIQNHETHREIVLKNDEAQRAITTTLLIAADGAQSNVRKKLAMPTREWDYGHDAIVTTVKTEKPHQKTAWQRFIHSGPLAFLPLTTQAGDEHYCSIVWSLSKNLSPDIMSLDDETFSQKLASAFEYRLGNIESVAKRFSFPLRQRHAIDYIQTGVALIGDAAHTIHPLAGQGVNLGLQDADVLAHEIARAVTRGVPLDDLSVLKRYQRQRKPENLLMMSAMEGFKQLFGSEQPSLHVLRNVGMGQINELPLLKQLIAKKAMGL